LRTGFSFLPRCRPGGLRVRLSKAVEQLAHDKIEARLGGIYTLERLAIEAIAQMRSPPWWRCRGSANASRDRSIRRDGATTIHATDIAAVLQVLRRRPDAGREREKLRDWRLDLRMTDLRGAFLLGAHLEGADLSVAHLEHANLLGAQPRLQAYERERDVLRIGGCS
jgi:Pentapeptide repeats (8 copies)